MQQKGFTLIELMVVVAIIAILSALALPAYQDYVARAQVMEAISLSSGAKLHVASFHADHGRFPADNQEAGLPAPASISGSYVSGVAVDGQGSIRATFGNRANAKIAGQVLVLSAQNGAGHLVWGCTGLEGKFLPSTCR